MSWINETGQFDASAEGMPDTVKNLVDAKGYTGVEDIVTAYNNATSKLGVPAERLLTIPEKPDDSDGWGNVFAKLGRPDSADGYKPEVKMPDGIEGLDDELVKQFSEVGHGIGLTNSQLSKIIQFQLDTSAKYIKEQTAAEAKAAEVAEADKKNAQAKVWEELKVKHSVKTDDDMKKLTEGAKSAAEKIGLYEVLEKHGLGDDPEVVGKLIALNSRLSDAIVPDGGNAQTLDKEARLEAIKKNPAFGDNMHPDHNKVMKEFQAIFGIG